MTTTGKFLFFLEPVERKLQRWEGLISSWVSFRASWEDLRASWEGLRASWEGLRASWEGLRAGLNFFKGSDRTSITLLRASLH